MNPHTSEAIARGIVDVARKGRNIGAGVGAGLGGAVGLAHGLKKDEKGKRHVGRGALHGAIGAAGGGVLGAGAGGVGGLAAGFHKHMPDIQRAAEEAMRDAHDLENKYVHRKYGSAGYLDAVQAGFLDELEKIADATSYAKGKGLARVKELLTGSHAAKLKERNVHIFDRMQALRARGVNSVKHPIREALGRAGTVRKDARELEELKVLGARAGGAAATAGLLAGAGAGAHHALKKREPS